MSFSEPIGAYEEQLIEKGTVMTVKIVGAEEKENNAKTGRYVRVDCQVMDDGDFKGELLVTYMTTVHSNNIAVRIGRKLLETLRVSLGLDMIEGPEDLIGRMCEAVIGVQKATAERESQNTITRFQATGTSEDDTPF